MLVVQKKNGVRALEFRVLIVDLNKKLMLIYILMSLLPVILNT